MKESPRTRARELVLQCLYACEHGQAEPDEALDKISIAETLSEGNLKFARTLLQLVVKHRTMADGYISRLAQNWRLERIAAIDRDILRMAIIELEMVTETPVKVVLNEAIELAKKFSTIESSKFVNGILDNFVKQLKRQI
jgi:N utilization substance protein B